MYMTRGRFWKIFVFLLLLISFLSIWHTYSFGPNGLIQEVAEFDNTFPFHFSLNTAGLQYVYPVYKLPKSDYATLINITDFKFILLNKCNFATILLVLVHSAPTHYDRRKCIRETWGSKQPQVTVLFMLGIVTDMEVQNQILEENDKHKDITQGSFIDIYRNMTYKHVMSLKYASYHCPQAKYILKTDDDVFVNMQTMLDFLILDLSPYGARKLLLCERHQNLEVQRSPNSKWGVSFSEYNESYYPHYCSGWTITYSPDVVFNLYREVQKSQYFWIDDVLVTGFVRRILNITISDISQLVLSSNNMKKMISDEIKNRTIPKFLFGPINLSVQNMYRLCEATIGCSYKSILNLIR